MVQQLVFLIFLLLLSAYFSGTETAFFSLSRLEIESLKRKNSPYLVRILTTILSSLDDVLITILAGNMVVNVFASAIGEELGARFFPGIESEILSIALMTTLLLVVGELTPKRIAVNHSRAFSSFSAVPLFMLHKVFIPVRIVLNGISRFILKFLSADKSAAYGKTTDLILSTVQLGYKQNVLSNSELQLFRSFFRFRHKDAGDLMIPRNHLTGVSVTTGIPELLERIEKGDKIFLDSVIPVYKQTIDHLCGYIMLKDLLPYKYGLKEHKGISSLLRSFYIVPESKDLNELMTEMRRSDSKIALLVDEYGGTAGLITFRQISEYLLSYFKSEKKSRVSRLDSGEIIIPGSLSIEDLSDLLKIDIHVEDKTAAGIILNILDNIPKEGDAVVFEEHKFIVEKMDGVKIDSISVRKL